MSVKTKIICLVLIPLLFIVGAGTFFSWKKGRELASLERHLAERLVAWEVADANQWILVDSALAKLAINEKSRDFVTAYRDKTRGQRELEIGRLNTRVEALEGRSELKEIATEVLTNAESLQSFLGNPMELGKDDQPNFEALGKQLVESVLALSIWLEQGEVDVDPRLLFAENAIRQFKDRLDANLTVCKFMNPERATVLEMLSSLPSPSARGLGSANALLGDNGEVQAMIMEVTESKKNLIPSLHPSLFDYFSYATSDGWASDAQKIKEQADRLNSGLREEVVSLIDESKRQAKMALAWFIGSSIFLVLLTTAIAVFTAYSILSPVSKLTTAASELSAGNLDQAVTEGASRRDEYGKVFQAFDQLRTDMNDLSSEIGGVQSAILNGQPHVRTRSENLRGRWGQLAGQMNQTLLQYQNVNDELLENERVLQESQRRSLLGRMAGGMAHDFNNMLAVMIGFAELAEEDAPNPEPLQEIRRAGLKARDLVERLMAVGRKNELNLEVFNLADLVRESEESVLSILPPNVDLLLELEGDHFIRTDETSFSQILLNLCINGRDAMEDGGAIRISTGSFTNDGHHVTLQGDATTAGDYWYLEVADQGTGIPDESLRQIFEPFYTTKKVTDGTGLGLAMVYSLMQQAGGWVDVITQVGMGSAFRLFFPVADGTQVRKAGVKEDGKFEHIPSGVHSILLVEDDASMLQLIDEGLRKLGYNVTACADGEQGLRESLRRNTPPDFILSDVRLP
ncbi:MAG: ATP-binding protein, partial [Verrucomicrobiota bacterium]